MEYNLKKKKKRGWIENFGWIVVLLKRKASMSCFYVDSTWKMFD